VNRAADPSRVPAVDRSAASFHASLDGYEPTPVHSLSSVALELGIDAVLVKDESNRLGLPAFKILGASWAVERMLTDRPDVHRLVAASAGNHGRAVARAAALRRLRCRVFLPSRSTAARRDAIASEGAEVVVVDGTYEDAVRAAEEAGREPGAVTIADVGTSGPAEWVIDGYATLFDEAARQAEHDLVIVPVGVGSLAAAAARHGAERALRVIGVEPVDAACLTASLEAGRPASVPTPGTVMAGLDCQEISAAAWRSLQAGIHGTVTVDDAAALVAVAELEEHGLLIGESGAAPLAALRQLAGSLEPSTRALLIATEGRTGGS